MNLEEQGYPFQTVASYSCGAESAIVGGSVTRTCGGDGSSTLGTFDGTEPDCEGVRVCMCMCLSGRG